MPDTDEPTDYTMLPDAFRQAQHELGLSDAQLAQVLRYSSPAHVRRHKVRNTALASYRRPSPQTVALLIAYLEGYRPKDWPG